MKLNLNTLDLMDLAAIEIPVSHMDWSAIGWGIVYVVSLVVAIILAVTTSAQVYLDGWQETALFLVLLAIFWIITASIQGLIVWI